MEEFRIEKYIPFGSKNAISRLELHNATGLSDRELRNEICEARRERGCCIINLGEGYFHPTIEEYEQKKSLTPTMFAIMTGLIGAGWLIASVIAISYRHMILFTIFEIISILIGFIY